MTSLTLFFDYEKVTNLPLTEDDFDYAQKQNWTWPLYRCPLCNNVVGTVTLSDETQLDEHFYDLNGHWRRCDASWATAVLIYENMSAIAIRKEEGTPEPQPVHAQSSVEQTADVPAGPNVHALKGKRPSRAAKARRRRYRRRQKPPNAA